MTLQEKGRMCKFVRRVKKRERDGKKEVGREKERER